MARASYKSITDVRKLLGWIIGQIRTKDMEPAKARVMIQAATALRDTIVTEDLEALLIQHSEQLEIMKAEIGGLPLLSDARRVTAEAGKIIDVTPDE